MFHHNRFGTPFAQVIRLKVPKMHIGPNFWPLGPPRASPMCAGRLEVQKYESVCQDERFGASFVHVFNLKVSKDAHRAKFLTLRATLGHIGSALRAMDDSK